MHKMPDEKAMTIPKRDELPEDGFVYMELRMPNTGVTMDGAIDEDSLEKIIEIIMSAKVDRSYVRPASPTSELVAALEKIKKYAQGDYPADQLKDIEQVATAALAAHGGQK